METLPFLAALELQVKNAKDYDGEIKPLEKWYLPDPGQRGEGGKKLSYPGGGGGWTPQFTPRKNWIIFEKKEITL